MLKSEPLTLTGGGRHLGTDDEQPVLDDTTIHPRISHYLTHKAAPYYYGKENWGEDGKVLQEWTGIMGYTLDRQPIVGEAPGQKGLWICAGFNGHGKSPSHDMQRSRLTECRHGSHVSIC